MKKTFYWFYFLVLTIFSQFLIAQSGGFQITNPMNESRQFENPPVVILLDGRIFVSGGVPGTGNAGAGNARITAEIFDPISESWSYTGSMHFRRVEHQATLLDDGTILITGGHASSFTGANIYSSAEIYDPTTGIFTLLSTQMNIPRTRHKAVLLGDGKVLIIGGHQSINHSSAELFDPISQSFTLINNMNTARSGFSATLLNTAQILIVGGDASGSDAELYDQSTQTFIPIGNTHFPRGGHRATLLNSGKVLITGGYPQDTAELFDPSTNTFTLLTNTMNEIRRRHTATRLNNGTVLVAGGITGTPIELKSAEIFDPSTETFTMINPMNDGRFDFGAVKLINGNVLIIGGAYDGSPGSVAISSVEIFTIDSSLIAYYPFNGNANDESGNGYDGVVLGATLTNDRFENPNSAYDFNGNDYIDVANGVNFEFDTEMTAALFMYVENIPITGVHFLISNWAPGNIPASGDAGFSIHFSNGDLDFSVAWLSNAWEAAHIPMSEIPVNEWFHIAGVRDSSELRIYLNGVLIAVDPSTAPNIYNPHQLVRMGSQPTSGSSPYTGKMDQVQIFNFALTQNQIDSLYHEGGWELTTWQSDLTIVEDGGLGNSQVLTFGQDSTATDSLDSALGEIELPPLPPPSIFDARFEFPTNPAIHSYTDFRNDTLEAIDWKIVLQGTYPMNICWQPSLLPYGTFYLVDAIGGIEVNIDMKTDSCVTITNSAISTLYIKYGRQNNVIVDVNAGWNIISVPLEIPSMQEDDYYQGNTSDAFAYSTSTGYLISDTLELGRAYWMKFPSDTSYNIQGINHRSRIALEAGWNLIGPFDFTVLVSNITTEPPGIIASTFFEYNGGYFDEDTLKPGKGYWVKASSAGYLILDPSILAKQTEDIFASISEYWGKIFIEDAAGNKMTLFVSEDDVSYELPPLPPGGIFDVRYTTGNLVENISDEPRQIRLSSLSYPVTISVEGIQVTVSDIISGEIVNNELGSGERVVIGDSRISILKISGKLTGQIPVAYSLEQNYPNPFNPSTVIEFSLPENVSNVRLTIFNVLGERVAELVNTTLEAGKYSYQWDAVNAATGIYIYELRTNNFVSVKKMMLLK